MPALPALAKLMKDLRAAVFAHRQWRTVLYDEDGTPARQVVDIPCARAAEPQLPAQGLQLSDRVAIEAADLPVRYGHRSEERYAYVDWDRQEGAVLPRGADGLEISRRCRRPRAA